MVQGYRATGVGLQGDVTGGREGRRRGRTAQGAGNNTKDGGVQRRRMVKSSKEAGPGISAAGCMKQLPRSLLVVHAAPLNVDRLRRGAAAAVELHHLPVGQAHRHGQAAARALALGKLHLRLHSGHEEWGGW